MKLNITAAQEHSARPEFRCRQQFPHHPAPQSAMRSLRADYKCKCNNRSHQPSPLGEGGRRPGEGRLCRDDPIMGCNGEVCLHQSPAVTASPRGEPLYANEKRICNRKALLHILLFFTGNQSAASAGRSGSNRLHCRPETRNTPARRSSRRCRRSISARAKRSLSQASARRR